MEELRLRDLILRDPERAFSEMGQTLFTLGQDVPPIEGASFHIDLLAIDPQGRVIIVIVAEGLEGDEAHILLGRALAAASLVARWKLEELLQQLTEDQAEELGHFLEAEVHEVNRKQRVLLIAAQYDRETLSATEWLREQFGLHITCLEVGVVRNSETNLPHLLSSEVG